ncbi:MAG: hypothetical protein N2B03_05220 [Boseongicola sp.]
MGNESGTNALADVHEFRYRWKSAWLGGFAAGCLLVVALVGVTFGADLSSSWGIFIAVFAIAMLCGILALFIFLGRRAPVQMRVGPEGLDMSLGFKVPLAWRDIHRIRYLGETSFMTGKQAWLVADPSPGVVPTYRFMGPKKAEAWLLRRIGIRIPLHMLEAEPETVIRSIERFKPIRREAN